MRSVRAIGGKILGVGRLAFALLVVASMTRTVFELHTWFGRGLAAVVALTAAWAAVTFLRALVAGGRPAHPQEHSSTM